MSGDSKLLRDMLPGLIEMKVLLSMLYRNFDVERVGGAEGVRENFVFLMPLTCH